MSKATPKRRLSMAIRQQAAESGVGHLIGVAEKAPEERGLSMAQQLKKLNLELARISAELQQTLAENNELKHNAGSATSASAASSATDGANARALEDKVRELTLQNEQQKRDFDELQAQTDALTVSFNLRLTEVEDMEDLISSLEDEIQALKKGGSAGEVTTLRAELEYAKEKEASLVQDKKYALAQAAEATESLNALKEEYSHSREKNAELAEELNNIKVERDASKTSETENLSKMRQENAALMSEAVRTTQLLGTLQEDIVTSRDNLTKAQMQVSDMKRAGAEKDQTIEKLTDKVAFLQTAIETINDEKITLTDESVKHTDLLRKIESDFYKKKEELDETKKKLAKHIDENANLLAERDRFAAAANPELMATLEASVADEKKEGERLRKRISELQRSVGDEEKVSAALREELHISQDDLENVKAQMAEVSDRCTDLLEELGKLRTTYGQKKEACLQLTKENIALKQGGASGVGSDELSKLVEEREDLLDTIAALEISVEEQNANLSDAAKDVDFLEKKVLKLDHQMEKMTQYRAQNKEFNAQLQQLRHENNELVKQVAQFQRVNDLRNGTLGAPPAFGSRGMVQSMGVSNRSLMSEYPSSVMGSGVIPPPLRLGSSDGLGGGLPTSGLSATNKKLRITQEKLSEERKERKAAMELLKLVLTEMDQNSAHGEEPPEKPDKLMLTKQWIQMNGRKAGNQDFGYHDAEAAVGLSVDEDEDGTVGLRAKMTMKSGDVEAIEETEIASFVQATEGIEHIMLGWHVMKHYPQKPSKAPSHGVIVADVFSLCLTIRTDGSESFISADKDRRRRVHFNDVTSLQKGVKDSPALQAAVQSIEKHCLTIVSQSGNDKCVSVLECISVADRDALYNTIVCLIAQTNKAFNHEALQIIQISSAAFRRKKASTMANAGGMASTQQDANNIGMSKNPKKVAHSNKLNHSTMKTLAAMGHFDTGANVDRLLDGDTGDDDVRDSDGRSLPHVSDDGKKSERKSVKDDGSDIDDGDCFADKPMPAFNNSGRGSLSREASVSQNIDYGQIYRGTSKDLDISSGTNSLDAPTRPSLTAGSSTYNLTSNPLSLASYSADTEDSGNRVNMLSKTSLSGTENKPATRRTSVTMAGIGKTQQPINIKGRRKSVVK